MAGKVRILTEDTINKIAAGEVIENSASVVKELVENSIDAGSTEIHVEIKGGGRQLIRVTDNGSGMDHDDAVLCLERHATSKIRKVDDIEAIGTLGFRGEAIPSIASISKFTLLTHTKDAKHGQEGTMVIVDGGQLIKVCSAARSFGTTMEVKNLFFNVPARRKFQRSPAHDTTEVVKMLSNLALAYPKISFELVSEQQSLLLARATSNDSLLEGISARIAAVLGSDYLKQCCEVDYAQDNCQLIGCVGLPLYSRPNRTGQHLFINGRAVFSPLISHLVREAYGTALPTNRHPLFVLHLVIPGGLVDVNVHPQKREVRLRQNELFKEVILKGVGKALQSTSLHEVATFPISMVTFTPLPTHKPYAPKPLPAATSLPWEDPTPQEIVTESLVPLLFSEPIVRMAEPLTITLEPSDESALSPINKSAPKVLAAVKGYLLLDPATCRHLVDAQAEMGNVILVDQRAAHHRILFERLKQDKAPAIQPLLIPATIEFSAIEASCVRETLPQLRSMGFEVDEFGQNTFLVRAVPSEFEASDAAALLSELVEQLRDYQSDGLKQQEREKKLSLAASRLAVKRKEQLSLLEAQQLINQLFNCESPLQCPQGRPTIVSLTDRELTKHFS